MMDYENFKKEFLAHVEEEIEARGLEDISCRYDTIDSPDGVTDRLLVSVGDSKMSMAFRIKEIYTDVDKGENLLIAVDKTLNTIEANVEVIKEKEAVVKNFVLDYEQVKDNTFLRLIPGTSPMLKDTPHKMVGDMALVVNINVESMSGPDGRSCVMITNPLLQEYGVDEDQLFATARDNSVEMEPITAKSLLVQMAELMGRDPDELRKEMNAEDVPEQFIISNDSAYMGASVIAYPEFADIVKDNIGNKVWLIPSSVHEFIVLKDDGKPAADKLNRMIYDINRTSVTPRERLSDQCFHYDAVKKELTIGTEYEKLKEKAPSVKPDELIPASDIDIGPDL